MTAALARFESDRASAHARAAADGVSGLDLAVVSLVHTWVGCTLATTAEEKREHGRRLLDEHDAGRLHLLPSEVGLEPERIACLDRPNIAMQYQRALAWDERVDWAQIVTSPAEADEVIAEGKLAVVLSVEASDFLAAYAESLPEWPTDDQVRAAMHRLLDDFPAVTTLQPAHQMDTALFGTADIMDNLRRSQLQRLRTGILRYTVDVIQENLGKRDALQARTQAYNAFRAHEVFFTVRDGTTLLETPRERSYRNTEYARWLYGAIRSAGGHSSAAFAVGASARKPNGIGHPYLRRDTAYAQTRTRSDGTEIDGTISSNDLGISAHGGLLLDVLLERGMTVDLSHASEYASTTSMRWLDARLGEDGPQPSIVYLSHAIVRDSLTVPRELTVSHEQLEMLAERDALVGLRTADDPLWLPTKSLGPAPGSASQWFGGYLRGPDCQESVVSFGYALGWAHDLDVPVAFGSDLNGFINHVGPTGLLRGSTYAAGRDRGNRGCASVVGGIGSEVDTRGVAHVGLLPAAGLQLLHHTRDPRVPFDEVWTGPLEDSAPRRTDAEDAVAALWSGAEQYLRIWDRAAVACARSRRDTRQTGSTRPCPRPRGAIVAREVTAPSPATLDALTDYQTTPSMGATTASTVSTYLDPAFRLPLLRAVEGVLPWWCDPDEDPEGCQRTGRRGQALPQLPNTIGFLTGVTSYAAQHFRPTKSIMAKLCKDVWGRDDRRAICDHLRYAPGRGLSVEQLRTLNARALGGDYNRQFLGDTARYRSAMTELYGTDPAAGQDTYQAPGPHSLSVAAQLDRIAEEAAAVGVMQWEYRDPLPHQLREEMPVCFDSDAYTEALTPGMFESGPYNFEGAQMLGQSFFDLGGSTNDALSDVDLLERLFRSDTVDRKDGGDWLPAHKLPGATELLVDADDPFIVGRRRPTMEELGDACLCALLFRLEGEVALTAFDRQRLAACAGTSREEWEARAP